MAYDIVGEALDLVGSDDDGVGAAPPPSPVARARKPGAAPRRLPLGFSATAVAAGATVNIPVVIQNQAYRLEELIIPSSIGASFTVEDLKVGNQPQFAASGSIPALAFSELCARQIALKCTTCNSGISIILTVKNTSAGPLDFRAAGIGSALD